MYLNLSKTGDAVWIGFWGGEGNDNEIKTIILVIISFKYRQS